MRVIAGSARRLLLKTLDSKETRPTTDRIKETLFNMIHSELPGIDFLDLFAGSGGIGIEALSRGAERAVFIENNPKAAAIIRENIEHTHFTEKGTVLSGDFMSMLSRLQGSDYRFSIVFMDPPYGKGLERKAMQLLSTLGIVDQDTLFIIEADIRDALTEEIEAFGYTLVREKLYKTNKHLFFRKKETE